jgi:integral membrane protein (TIGR01906 family)
MKKILLTILIILLIFLINLKFFALNVDFYEKEFVKYNIYDEFTKVEVKDNVDNLISYLKNKNVSLNKDFFSEREILHLKDVKDLIYKFSILFYILSAISIIFIMYLIYTKQYKIIGNSLVYSGIIIICLSLILFLFNFNYIFTKFHLIFFRNDLWLLSPESNLIKLFPLNFFRDIFKRIILNSIIISAIIIIIGLLTRRIK